MIPNDHGRRDPVLSGEVVHDLDPLEPPAAGQVLLCCSRPLDGLVLDL